MRLPAGKAWPVAAVSPAFFSAPRSAHAPGAARVQHTAPAAHARWWLVQTRRSAAVPGRELTAQALGRARRRVDEHERSELPWARIDSGGTPPRIARGATPRRTGALRHGRRGCAGPSVASPWANCPGCNPRELTAQALGPRTCAGGSHRRERSSPPPGAN